MTRLENFVNTEFQTALKKKCSFCMIYSHFQLLYPKGQVKYQLNLNTIVYEILDKTVIMR